MIGAKAFDPVVGVDVHIIQPPGPVPPIPVPHPFVGMLVDPIDFAPVIGATVLVNGMPRATAGTGGQCIPPHIPIGGTFIKPPANECEVFMGSSTVLSDNDPQSFLGMPALSCHDVGMPPPPRPNKKRKTKSLVLPTSVVMAVPAGGPVLIGGPPTVSMMALGMRAAMAGLGKAFRKLRKVQKGPGRVGDAMRSITRRANRAGDQLADALRLGARGRQRIRNAICTVTGHPVDVATGRVFTDHTDFELPGPIPFEWKRTWSSTSTYEGDLGHGWHHTYGQALYVREDVVLYRDDEGRSISFPPLNVGQEYFDRTERLTLIRESDGYSLRTIDGQVFVFRDVGRPRGEHALVRIEDLAGNRIRLGYARPGLLAEIIDSGGRSLRFTHDSHGRISTMTAPHPERAGEQFVVVRYEYDERGDLVRVVDALGNPAYYRYHGHLLSQETDRNGLSFYFEYDGPDETAKCVRTWGDGGIYDHKLRYDDDLSLTTVVNSLGHATQYEHQDGLVIRTVDAGGATWLTEHNEHAQPLEETDPLGNTTAYAYDERGNAAGVTHPDGATISVEYDAGDNPVKATDAAGGHWSWRYDDRGRLMERVNPLGRITRYEYRGAQLVGVTSPEGRTTGISHDDAGNVSGVFTPDGASTRWTFDAAGRPVAARNAEGALQQRKFDLMGRIVRVQEPDGNVREMRYDAEGNVVRARDAQHDVRFAYQGMGRLVMRSEAGTSVRFRYDTEEQLTAVENEESRVYGFELDPTGEVREERGFDGLRRRYSRDLLGRVTEVKRPSGMRSRYEYDVAGRVTGVLHSDGSSERYAYGPDGELIEAENDAAMVTFERDPLGRIVREQCGEHWVESDYGPLGLRSKMESSLGASQEIERNAMGDVTGVSGSFEARFKRDLLGQELSRDLPGGVRSKWQRDKLGRPMVHEIWSGHENHRTVRYEWAANDRLVQLLDEQKGPIRLGHDPLGNLAWAHYPDGSRELRMPDAVGNLFRREDRRDRTYGDAGQLLESTDDQGRTTRYEYDAEGNLSRKLEPYGRTWRYHWNAAGMLERVDRPDGRRVWFTYDALGRRLSKTFRGKTTRWLWDGNNPLHEWVEEAKPELFEKAQDENEGVRRNEGTVVAMHPPTGPPEAGLAFAGAADPYLEGAASESAPITWLFEPESFSPMAKLRGDSAKSILTDHLGTPVAMLDDAGELTWSAQLNTYGEIRSLDAGERGDCPFRFPGQYEDAETGLYYNRFRYYDPAAGAYISQDPVALDAGFNLHAYAPDPHRYVDPLGLANKYRRKNGQYGKKPGPKPKPKPSIHGNSRTSTKPAVLYAMYDGEGDFQKWGITQETTDPRKRYGTTLPDDWDVVPMEKGSRSDMLDLERELVEKDPGPRNREKWAGKNRNQPLSAKAAKVCGKK